MPIAYFGFNHYVLFLSHFSLLLVMFPGDALERTFREQIGNNTEILDEWIDFYPMLLRGLTIKEATPFYSHLLRFTPIYSYLLRFLP